MAYCHHYHHHFHWCYN